MMVRVTIQTRGMHCLSCEILVKETLLELKGVTNVEASYSSGRVSVDFDDSKLNRGQIEKMIAREGYNVVG